MHDAYATAVTEALHPIFYLGAAIALVAFALTWLLREIPLRAKAKPGEAIPAPASTLEAA